MVLQESIAASYLVSLVAGAMAGIAGGVMSTPADVLLTMASTGEVKGSLLDKGMLMLKTEPGSLFRGLGPRCVLFAAIIAGQVGEDKQTKRLSRAPHAPLTHPSRTPHTPHTP